ncbi:MAG: hypothetical protein JKY33_02650 [Bacteroidia bacterium]|nr:hypothetical protein [Bacteroidia bacterium]
MKKLSPNWITEGLIDFEYKKYLLLAYLKDVSESFDDKKLYPFLADIIDHYKNLLSIKDYKREISDKFPNKISSVDLKNFLIKYEKLIDDSEIMKEIESIIDYSLPKLEKYLKDGKEIYDFIENYINISPIGITPIYSNEGYLFLRNGKKKKTAVYEYQITLFNKSDEKFRGISTNYLTTYEPSFSNTFESIKQNLIKSYKKLPNPATFAIESEIVFPFSESLLPIAKRCFVRYMASAS